MGVSKEYEQYLLSPEWIIKRDQVRERAKGYCENCKRYVGYNRVQVHHKTYDRIYHEDLTDLQAVCRTCHPKLDKKRRRNKRAQQQRERLKARINGWMTRVHGEDWKDSYTWKKAEQKFRRWLRKKIKR